MRRQVEFDFSAAAPASCDPLAQQRSRKGKIAYLTGQAAEAAVARHYVRRGYRVLDQRWRCGSGEVDLIVALGEVVVFVEVKASNTHDRAAAHLSRRQLRRIFCAASEYAGQCPKGQLTEMRIDLATVNGFGEIDTREGLFADF